MKLSFLYYPVTDLDEGVAFHRDVLGLDESWRESDDTVAFWLPDRTAQVMVSTDPGKPGPMFLVDDAAAWAAEHPGVDVVIPRFEIPDGAMIGLEGPNGNAFYVFDQAGA